MRDVTKTINAAAATRHLAVDDGGALEEIELRYQRTGLWYLKSNTSLAFLAVKYSCIYTKCTLHG